MILYHGTSKRRLYKILEQDRLRAIGPKPAVCFTTRIGPARYWGHVSARADQSEPFVLRFNAKLLLEAGFTLMPFSDPCWGTGACDWEREVRIEENVSPVSEFLKGYGSVPWLKRKRSPWS